MFFYRIIITFLLPCMMVFFGILFSKNVPKHINGKFGYRTHRSMENKDTWNFAHKYCGRLLLYTGLVLVFLSFGAVYAYTVINESLVSTVLLAVVFAEIILLYIVFFMTERALKKRYGQNS